MSNNDKLVVTKNAQELAKKVAAWIGTLADAKSEYLWNLYAAAQKPFVTSREANLLASAIVAYLRNEQTEAKVAKVAAVSQFVGTVGERKTWGRLLLAKVFSYNTLYGAMNIHQFQDEAGNVIVWKTGTKLLTPDTYYSVKGTVKSHDVYTTKGGNSVNQTVLTRCDVDALEPEVQPAASKWE